MNYLLDLLGLLLVGLRAVAVFVVGLVEKHPLETFLAVLALLRLLGTTVQTGSKGVLFVFGRVRKELEPGFHPLLPVVMAVRKTPVRSITQDLPRQRLTTADGLVYDIQANIVYRVADPILALTQIDHLRKGIEALLPLIVADLFRSTTRSEVRDFKALESELVARAEEKLRRWGVTVEHAGFQSIAPTKKTLRLTQLVARGGESESVLRELIAQGVSLNAAVALLGADRRLVGRSTARYLALHRPARLAPAAEEAPATARLLPGEESQAEEKPPQGEEDAAAETQEDELVLLPDEAPVQAPPRPKKTTKGLQPRSWMRLRHRLRLRQSDQVQPEVAPIR
jgi:regulator of protease activity HflC (stomatin/prohibitin superfamily)